MQPQSLARRALCLLCFSPALLLAGARISGVTVENVTTTSAQIVWSTSEPAAGQVVLADIEYVGFRSVPQPPEIAQNLAAKRLQTVHRVTVDHLLPGTPYQYYVVATTPGGSVASTRDPDRRENFTTLPVNPNAPFDWRLDLDGPVSVYAGHDLWINAIAVTLAGPHISHFYFNRVEGLPAGVVFDPTYLSRENPEDPNDDHKLAPDGRLYLPNYDNYLIKSEGLKLQVGPAVPPGEYTLRLAVENKGVVREAAYNFRVRALVPLAARPAQPAPPMPKLNSWKSILLTLARKWCDPGHANDLMRFGYEPQIWYYDGGRTYYEIADYTKDPRWLACANNIVTQYRDDVIAKNGWVMGNRVFTDGLVVRYQRYKDERAREAIRLLATGSPWAGTAGILAGRENGDEGMRETALIVSALVSAAQVGFPRPAYLTKAVDFALGHISHVTERDPWGWHQAFYSALLSEALIKYWEATQDPRIPLELKRLLDWLWDNAYDARKVHGFMDHVMAVPPLYNSVVDGMIAPAYAWMWQRTGDPVYAHRADELFNHALDTGVDWSGKVFNQTFRWLFDYIRWRSAPLGMAR